MEVAGTATGLGLIFYLEETSKLDNNSTFLRL